VKKETFAAAATTTRTTTITIIIHSCFLLPWPSHDGKAYLLVFGRRYCRPVVVIVMVMMSGGGWWWWWRKVWIMWEMRMMIMIMMTFVM